MQIMRSPFLPSIAGNQLVDVGSGNAPLSTDLASVHPAGVEHIADCLRAKGEDFSGLIYGKNLHVFHLLDFICAF